MENKLTDCIKYADYLISVGIIKSYHYGASSKFPKLKFKIQVDYVLSFPIDTAYWYLQGMVYTHKKLTNNEN